MTDFIEDEYLKEQVHAIKEMEDLVTNITRVRQGMGVAAPFTKTSNNEAVY
jgi:hypothetical protein